MLEIKNLVVQIEDNRILNGLNLTVKPGEVAAMPWSEAMTSTRCPGRMESACSSSVAVPYSSA